MTETQRLKDMRVAMKQKFDTIKWAHHPCGRGSCFENTEITRRLLTQIAKDYNIKTVSDAGAGDLSWIKSLGWDVDYTGYDIRQWHPEIVLCDVTKDVLPETDLIVCRHVLNHIPAELREEAIQRFKESGSKYLFITHGNEEPPYGLGEPLLNEGELFPGGRTWYYGLYEL